jgi:hypothetical protein
VRFFGKGGMIRPLKICPNCDGRGFTEATMECEDKMKIKCKICNCTGKVDGEKFFLQTYREPHGSISIYHGPVLEKKYGFKNLEIIED